MKSRQRQAIEDLRTNGLTDARIAELLGLPVEDVRASRGKGPTAKRPQKREPPRVRIVDAAPLAGVKLYGHGCATIAAPNSVEGGARLTVTQRLERLRRGQ